MNKAMRKKKSLKRSLVYCLVLAGIAGIFTGCSRSKTASSTQSKMDKDHVYKAEYFAIPEGTTSISQIKIFNDQVYLETVSEENYYRTQIFTMKADGTEQKKIFEQTEEDDSTINSFSVDEDGNMWLLKTRYEEDASDPENIQYISKCLLVKEDVKKNEIFSTEINASEDFYPNGMLVDSKGTAYVFSSEALIAIDPDGHKTAEVDISDNPMNELFLTEEGKIIGIGYNQNYTEREIREYLPEQKKFSEPEPIKGNSDFYGIFKGAAGYDFFIKDTMDLYGYQVKTGEMTKLLNWVDSDLNANYIYSIAGLSDGRIFCVVHNLLKGGSEIAALTKVKPEDVIAKEVLTLSCLYINDEVMSSVIEYNKKSEKYRITIKDYSIYNTEENYEAGNEKLNMDIISGDVPDILCINDNSSFNSFADKGLFADINDLIEKDETFKKSDYLENIFTAFEKDGKLYSVAPCFSVSTMVGKSSDVGEEMGWTLDDLSALMASKPEGTKIIGYMSKETFIADACILSMGEYINWENNKANFNTPEFISLLNFANQFPTQEELERQSQEDFSSEEEETQNDYRNGKILLQSSTLESFEELHRLQKEVYGEEVTLIGFPSANKKGSVIYPYLEFAISQNSKKKDAAWDFIKLFFQDDFQDSLSWEWPVKLSSIQKKKEKEQTPQTYEDENGGQVLIEPTFMLNGKEEKLGLVTDEECEKVMAFLKSLTQVMRLDEKINDIIMEEAAAFFVGQKSVEETAKLIQNRVQTYLSEIQ